MRLILAVSLALLVSSPVVAAPATLPTHVVATASGMSASIDVKPMAAPSFTCPMHPEVVAGQAGKCPKCKMALVKQTHEVTVSLADAKKAPLKGAAVRLKLVDAHGLDQVLTLKGQDRYRGAFALTPGLYKVTAYVKPKGATKETQLQTTCQVK